MIDKRLKKNDPSRGKIFQKLSTPLSLFSFLFSSFLFSPFFFSFLFFSISGNSNRSLDTRPRKWIESIEEGGRRGRVVNSRECLGGGRIDENASSPLSLSFFLERNYRASFLQRSTKLVSRKRIILTHRIFHFFAFSSVKEFRRNRVTRLCTILAYIIYEVQRRI